MSYADLAAAAHLSVADYLGDAVERRRKRQELVRAVKSRPSFRPILADDDRRDAPSPTYADLDFESPAGKFRTTTLPQRGRSIV